MATVTGSVRPLRVAVLTAIVGRISDELRLPIEAAEAHAHEADFVCFTDRERYGRKHGPWRVLPPAWTHPSVPRRTARWHKALPHCCLPGYDAWVWLDGCAELRVSPLELARLGLDETGKDLATFLHHERDCVYEEELACVRYRKDDPAVMAAQTVRYREEGYPERHGMVETTCVVRRDTPAVRAFGEAWWAEMDRGSLRDQLSFNYVAWKLGTPFGLIAGWRERNAFFRFHPHHEY
jgi:hypothetical protein